MTDVDGRSLVHINKAAPRRRVFSTQSPAKSAAARNHGRQNFRTVRLRRRLVRRVRRRSAAKGKGERSGAGSDRARVHHQVRQLGHRPGAGFQEAGQQLRAMSAGQEAVHGRRRGAQEYVY